MWFNVRIIKEGVSEIHRELGAWYVEGHCSVWKGLWRWLDTFVSLVLIMFWIISWGLDGVGVERDCKKNAFGRNTIACGGTSNTIDGRKQNTSMMRNLTIGMGLWQWGWVKKARDHFLEFCAGGENIGWESLYGEYPALRWSCLESFMVVTPETGCILHCELWVRKRE